MHESEVVAVAGAGMVYSFATREAGGADAGTGTIAVDTEEHIEVMDLPHANGNTPDMMTAVSYLAAMANMTSHGASEVAVWASGHMAACLTDGGSWFSVERQTAPSSRRRRHL